MLSCGRSIETVLYKGDLESGYVVSNVSNGRYRVPYPAPVEEMVDWGCNGTQLHFIFCGTFQVHI